VSPGLGSPEKYFCVGNPAYRQRHSIPDPKAAVPQQQDESLNPFGIRLPNAVVIVDVKIVASIENPRHLVSLEWQGGRLLHNRRGQIKGRVRAEGSALGAKAIKPIELLKLLLCGEVTIFPGGAKIAEKIKVYLFEKTEAAFDGKSFKLSSEKAIFVNRG
jgi:hypothetical protein